RLDRIGDELAKLNRRAENDDSFLRLTREVAQLNESLQALAYAALGQSAPQAGRLVSSLAPLRLAQLRLPARCVGAFGARRPLRSHIVRCAATRIHPGCSRPE